MIPNMIFMCFSQKYSEVCWVAFIEWTHEPRLRGVQQLAQDYRARLLASEPEPRSLEFKANTRPFTMPTHLVLEFQGKQYLMSLRK